MRRAILLLPRFVGLFAGGTLLALGTACVASGAGKPKTTVAAPTLPSAPQRERENAGAGAETPKKKPSPEDSCTDCADRTASVLPPPHSQEAVQHLFSSANQPVRALSPDMAVLKTSRVMLQALSNTALDAAFGMQPQSDVLGANLLEGELASHALTVPPGKCITYVAQGGLGTVEIDMMLVRKQKQAVSMMALDEQEGPIAVLGRGTSCVRHREPKPFEATLTVWMRKGSGLVLVRAYER